MTRVALTILLLTPIASTSAAAPSTQPIERKDGHVVWTETSYLHGTAAEIHQTLNGQVDGLIKSRAKAKALVTDLEAKCDAAKQHAENLLLADTQYKALLTAVKDAEAARDTTRRTGTPQERLDAGAAYVKAKSTVDQRRKQVIDQDANVLQLGKELVEARRQLHEVDIAVGKEEIWRRELVEVIHTGKLLLWPPRLGKVGIVGTVTPRKAVGKDAFEAMVPFEEFLRTEEEHEGISMVRARTHWAPAIVRGVEGPWEVGKPIALNRALEVTGLEDAGGAGRRTVSLTRTKDDIDELLDAVDSGPADLPQAELDDLVRIAARKESPHRWGSVAPMIAALPPDLRPRPGEKVSAEKLHKIDERFSKDLVGDVVDMTLTLLEVRMSDTGVDILATPDLANRNRQNVFFLSGPESLRAKAAKVHPGQEARITGTIKSVHMNPDLTIDVQIIDTAF